MMHRFKDSPPEQEKPVWVWDFADATWRPACLMVGMYPLHGDVRGRMQWMFLNGEAAYVDDDDWWIEIVCPTEIPDPINKSNST